MPDLHPRDVPWHGVRYQGVNGGMTLEGIRAALRPFRRRFILFYNGDDREVVLPVCRALRDEGVEVAEREHRWVEAGRVIAVDADALQPKYPMIGSLFDGQSETPGSGANPDDPTCPLGAHEELPC